VLITSTNIIYAANAILVVEHAGSPSAGAAAGLLAQQTLASAPVQYEGFEPSPYEVGGPQLELLPVSKTMCNRIEPNEI
jgi:hypothetical protein